MDLSWAKKGVGKPPRATSSRSISPVCIDSLKRVYSKMLVREIVDRSPASFAHTVVSPIEQ